MLENSERSGKERNGTERNGTERNGTEVIDAQYERGCRIRIEKLVLYVSSSMYGELISRPVPTTKTGQAPSRQYRTTLNVLNILAIYLVSLSGVADPSLTSEGSAMPLPSLGSAVGSGVTCGTLELEGNGIAFCTLHKYETNITTERPLSC